MPKNLLTPNNLRWLTVYLFLLLMILLLVFNLFGQPNQGVSANSTPTPLSNSVVNCKQVLQLSCKDVIGSATAKAKVKNHKAATATPTATATPKATATATAKPTVTVTAAVTRTP